MNVTDFTYLLQHPHKVVSPVHTRQLEEILEEYPYFQAARALHLKGLKNLNSFKYNGALKLTSAHTHDRSVLFGLITGNDYLQQYPGESPPNGVHKDPGQVKETTRETPVQDPLEITAVKEKNALLQEGPVAEKPFMIEESEDAPLPRSREDAENILDPALFTSQQHGGNKDDVKEVGFDLAEPPIAPKKNERHSFAEWLELAALKNHGSESDEDTQAGSEPGEVPDRGKPDQDSEERSRKFELIDRFLENNPKIVPDKTGTPKINIEDSLTLDKNELMTETLARLYLEQEKYKKAVQAYRILSLKYPEKSGFFADRIKAVEELRRKNK